jgi:F-type H+-transporting ATPase subunit a
MHSPSPLSQFEIWLYVRYPSIACPIVYLSNFGIVLVKLILVIGFVYFLLFRHYKKYSSLVGIELVRIQLAYLAFHKMIAESLASQAGPRGIIDLSIVLSCFLFLIAGNLMALFPYEFATTAHGIIPFTFAAVFNIYFLASSLFNLSFKFFYGFVPEGVPFILKPFIAIIEIASYLLRTFSLTLRLVANIMAGHVLVYIMTTFTIITIDIGVGIGILGIFSLADLCIVVLEVLIGAIQAYVFAVLLTVYLADATRLKH